MNKKQPESKRTDFTHDKDVKTESTRTLGNFDFQWTKTLYQNTCK